MGMYKNRTTRKFNQDIIALKLNSKPISGAHVHNRSAFGVCTHLQKDSCDNERKIIFDFGIYELKL